MPEILIEQALYGGQSTGGYRFLARSPGFLEDWLPEAQRICTGFGERPAEVACPECLFAQPFGKWHVAIVQVADQGHDDTGRPGALGFRLLILLRNDYWSLGGDPFLVADHFPPAWQARGELPVLSWPAEALPRRTVEAVQAILQSPDESPMLLGGVQALVDGGQLVFERPAPDTERLRNLWTLLPTSTRCYLWPATFAFGHGLDFDAVVVPPAAREQFTGYLTEDQAADYPQGRYELSLQVAAESGDQQELDALFARRSQKEVWRMGLLLFALVSVLLLVGNWLTPKGSLTSKRDSVTLSTQLDLPPAENYPSLSERDRNRLTEALDGLAKRVGVRPLSQPVTAEALLAAISDRLGTPDAKRDPGQALSSGPVERRLRSLLWKHGVAAYREPGLNAVELVEQLQKKVAPAEADKKDQRE